MRLEQPWKVAGRKIAPRPEILDECLVAATDKLRVRTPLVVGGRSAGARSAARTARTVGASGCLGLAFPLHPPGKPEKLRDEHLYGLTLPMLFLQGSRDAFALPGELEPVAGRIGGNAVVHRVADADHSFKVPRDQRSQEQTGADLAAAVLEFIAGGP